jgi:hypothetical protein
MQKPQEMIIQADLANSYIFISINPVGKSDVLK